jgi:hypothetical protein
MVAVGGPCPFGGSRCALRTEMQCVCARPLHHVVRLSSCAAGSYLPLPRNEREICARLVSARPILAPGDARSKLTTCQTPARAPTIREDRPVMRSWNAPLVLVAIVAVAPAYAQRGVDPARAAPGHTCAAIITQASADASAWARPFWNPPAEPCPSSAAPYCFSGIARSMSVSPSAPRRIARPVVRWIL